MRGHGIRSLVFVLTIAIATALSIAALGLLAGKNNLGATATTRETPSEQPSPRVDAATDRASVDASPEPAASVHRTAFVGRLTASICDLGVCCPALSAGGVHYLLILPPGQDWHLTDGRYEITDATGAIVARQGDTVSIEGDEAGAGDCWAAGPQHSIVVASLTVQE